MCDTQETSVSNWQRYCFTIGKTLQIDTVTVMVNDCTSISDMSAVFKYYMVKNKSDTLRLN